MKRFLPSIVATYPYASAEVVDAESDDPGSLETIIGSPLFSSNAILCVGV